ncbi:MAG: hypothetical protein ACREOZ_04070 [Gloeomargaritales cyanobacterium]
MPFAFIIVGTVLVISGVRGTSQQLLTLVKGDLQGKNGYLYWLVAILIIGSVGYIPNFKGLSRAFLALVLIVLVLKEGNPSNGNGGFFQQFTSALQQISQPSASAIGA